MMSSSPLPMAALHDLGLWDSPTPCAGCAFLPATPPCGLRCPSVLSPQALPGGSFQVLLVM